jgi:hypothetical protein
MVTCDLRHLHTRKISLGLTDQSQGESPRLPPRDDNPGTAVRPAVLHERQHDAPVAIQFPRSESAFSDSRVGRMSCSREMSATRSRRRTPDRIPHRASPSGTAVKTANQTPALYARRRLLPNTVPRKASRLPETLGVAPDFRLASGIDIRILLFIVKSCYSAVSCRLVPSLALLRG